jgi:hypothetical protein
MGSHNVQFTPIVLSAVNVDLKIVSSGPKHVAIWGVDVCVLLLCSEGM